MLPRRTRSRQFHGTVDDQLDQRTTWRVEPFTGLGQRVDGQHEHRRGDPVGCGLAAQLEGELG